MADLTATQLTDFQADLGINNDQSVFTDAELNRLWARASENYDAALVLALRQLMMNAARFNDYTVGQTSEKRSQIFENLRKALEYREELLDAQSQVKIVGMRATPPITKEVPADTEHPDEKTRRHNDSLPMRRYRRRQYPWW